MMPAETEPPKPSGLPMAITQSPTTAVSLLASSTKGSGVFELTLSTAISVSRSRPTSLACNSRPSEKVIVIVSAFSITWLLVMM